ncbi:sulfotransferase [Shimia abyssi]|uniref:Sulfotransferase family protein n=1 Tax=Shimia abyssi TaxID=1662395 RepID=A0A2P8F7A9_9RHOB|nr:sulfotransferase family protein [Shimia abyssi]
MFREIQNFRARVRLRQQPRQHVFLITYGRSGSTLVQKILNTIPGYCIRGENNNLLYHLFRSWAALSNCEPVQSHRRIGRSLTSEHPWFGSEQVDPDTLGRNLVSFFEREVLQPPPGTKASGFKEIRYHQDPDRFHDFLDFMHRFFPGTRFVFNYRAHDDVMKSGWWAHQRPERVKEILDQAETLFESYMSAHPDRCIRIDYDRYAQDPSALRPLFDFLGEAFEEGQIAQLMDARLDHLKDDKNRYAPPDP